MACAVCCCVSCHTSSGAPVFRLAAGARCRGWGGPEGEAEGGAQMGVQSVHTPLSYGFLSRCLVSQEDKTRH